MDLLAVDLVEADDEHRAVRLSEEGRADLDDAVRADGEEESIERGVMLAREEVMRDASEGRGR